MKLLHTSDWHLGRSLHGEPMLEHQRAFLRWLVGLAVERQVEAVLVAGDVYDRAVPPVDAVAVLDDALAAFAAVGVQVVITSGNHDSAVRLGFGSALAEHAGVHLRTDLRALRDPVVLGDVAVYGIPYLLPDAVMTDLGAERSHASVLAAAVSRIRDDAAARDLDKVVVLAHAFVTGGVASESERDIRIGGIGDVPATLFEGITYTALGHLHGAQQVTPTVRYSGSPVPFSFSERYHHKSVALVDIAADGAVTVDLVPAPVPRPMSELTGRLEDLLAATDGPPADAWLRVVLTDPSAPLRRWNGCANAGHTLVLDFRPDVEPVETAADLARLRQEHDPIEVCALFVEWVDSTLPDRVQRDALTAAVEAVQAAQSA